MTGFGHAEKVTEQCRITVEMKSVNHRYLDLNIKMPRRFNMLEGQVRNLMKQYMQRGKVDVFITYEDYTENRSCLKYNKELAPYVCKWLKVAGHEATLCIAPEGQLHSLNDEIKYFIEEENKQNYDLSVQLHLNAFNGEAYGCEAYCYNANGLPEAQQISAKLGTVWHDRGAEERPGLYWTRKTKAKAVLVESFFCDNKDDYAKAKKLGMDAHGKLIAEGILGKTITIAPAQPKAKYYIQAGAYGTKENADVMVKVLKKKGFSASIRKVSGSVPYRVQVGTYRTKKAANKVVKKLKAAGFTVLVKNL